MPGAGTTPIFDEDDYEDDKLAVAGDSKRAAPEPDGEAGDAPTGEPAVTPPARGGGSIDGADLDRVLDAGPGAFLAAVEVRPVFAGKRFRGWEIVGIRSDSLARSPLRRGDMVVAVNDRRLQRPEDLQKVWDELRDASELVVSGVRSGQNFALRYEIVRDPAQGPGPR